MSGDRTKRGERNAFQNRARKNPCEDPVNPSTESRRALPSATNFVTMDCGGDGALARRVLAELVARDIFVRMPFVAPHDRCIRVSAGLEPDLAAFAAALPAALAMARA